ncbi:MAG: hypothetical protein VX223_08145 [Myxococcota bacterium]|nr:hypothetical protein [Myxococcota bacterium]
MKQSAALIFVLVVGCGADPLATPYASRTIKAQDSEQLSGKADDASVWIVDGEDICETMGLYEDDYCDHYCPRIDAACDPSVYLDEDIDEELEALDCSLETLECAEGEVLIDSDDNGCGDTCVEALVGCASNNDCADGNYCARPMGDCSASVGTCEPLPECELDTATYKPQFVCGCDGSTFFLACDAAHEGINIAYEGICEYE